MNTVIFCELSGSVKTSSLQISHTCNPKVPDFLLLFFWNVSAMGLLKVAVVVVTVERVVGIGCSSSPLSQPG